MRRSEQLVKLDRGLEDEEDWVREKMREEEKGKIEWRRRR